MRYEEIKKRCEDLKAKASVWSEELKKVNEWDLNEVNAVLYNVNKMLINALEDEQLNKLFNFSLASCELFVRSVRRYDLTCTDLSKSLKSLTMIIDATLEKMKKEEEIINFKRILTESAAREENEESKAALMACADHADKIFDIIY